MYVFVCIVYEIYMNVCRKVYIYCAYLYELYECLYDCICECIYWRDNEDQTLLTKIMNITDHGRWCKRMRRYLLSRQWNIDFTWLSRQNRISPNIKVMWKNDTLSVIKTMKSNATDYQGSVKRMNQMLPIIEATWRDGTLSVYQDNETECYTTIMRRIA